MFYIENVALRLLFCVGTVLVVVLAVGFFRASAAGVPFVLDPLKHLVLPIALGVVTTFMWKPIQK
jgi:hypothetical protein